jgi:phage tail sheath gpL-like
MPIPTAVATSIITPGIYISINLLAGAASPSSGVQKVLLICPKSSAGTLTANSEIREGGGEATAATAYGKGTPGHLAAKLLYQEYPAAQVEFAAPTAGAGTATLNVTATGTPTGNNAVLFSIAGREFEVAWLASESADTFKANAILAINQRTDILPVTASSGGSGIITIDGKVTGRISNDIKVRATLVSTATGTEAINTNTYTNLAGGSADPDFTTILGLAAGGEYHYIVACLSNVDAVLASSSSNAQRTIAHIANNNTGLDAKLQQLIYASTTTQSAAKAAAIFRNSQFTQHLLAENGLGLPCELAGRECGGRLAGIAVDPAVNRIGEVLDGYFGSGDPVTDRPTLAESEDMLGNGVSLVGYNASLQPYIIRPITTYSLDSGGGPDRRLLDVQNVDATYIVARDLRTALRQEFVGAKVQRDSLPGEDPPPAGVTEERDIKAFLISRMRFWAREGVVQTAVLDEVILDGSLIVEVNDSDPTQVDMVVPMKVVQPWAKGGLVVERRPG